MLHGYTRRVRTDSDIARAIIYIIHLLRAMCSHDGGCTYTVNPTLSLFISLLSIRSMKPTSVRSNR